MGKRDIGQLDTIAATKGWDREERRQFGRLVEYCKEHGSRGGAGRRGADFTYQELITMAETGECP